MINSDFQISREQLQQIWNQHDLGAIDNIAEPQRGIINACFIVNNNHVIRLDRRQNEGQPRYEGERRAFDLLAETGVPVPYVVVVDTSRAIVPVDYIIMTKLDGQDLIEHWDELFRTYLITQGPAYDAGRQLATIHGVKVGQRFGEFAELGYEDFDSWADYIVDFNDYYGQVASSFDALDDSVLARIREAIATMQPMFETISEAALVHGDFQFENLLYEADKVSAIFDFEWALAGDPLWDFRKEDQWDEVCIGSRSSIYAAYRKYGHLGEGYQERIALYKVLMLLDDVAIGAKHGERDEIIRARQLLEEKLIVLEALLRLKAHFPKFYTAMEETDKYEFRELSTPMTDEGIADIEVLFGVPLPESYKTFLKCTRTMWLPDTIRMWRHLDSFALGTICVADYWWGADGDLLYLDTRNGLIDGEYPVLYYAHDFGGEPDGGLRKIADSFGEWLEHVELDFED